MDADLARVLLAFAALAVILWLVVRYFGDYGQDLSSKILLRAIYVLGIIAVYALGGGF